LIVTWSAPGHRVYGRTKVTWPAAVATGAEGQGWISNWGIRTFYWLDRPYNLLEVYYPNGLLHELYVHVASLPSLHGHTLAWHDYELDVIFKPDVSSPSAGGRLMLVDEDEFAQAAVDYGYSPDFQAHCYAIADEAAAWLPTYRPG
jgi:predicted RNA-binding protein associated with RNAse of E/G family